MNVQNTAAAGQSGSLLDTLYGQQWVVITASLELVNKGRFLQPTGFPDIGACIYRDKDGNRWCLVESEQSMANRLEAVCMKHPGVWVDALKQLPVIAVRDPSGDLLTTNLCEPHRIASSYVLEGQAVVGSGKMTLKDLVSRSIGLKNNGDSWPLDKRGELDKIVFALDPGAMLHGFQFVQWKFVGLRQSRLLHGRLEAELADEPEVHYGMVKWDAIEPESAREERANKGQSIAAKSRVVPKQIIAFFEIDVLGLKSLALEETQQKFLLGLALWKIGAFLADKPSFDPRSRQTVSSLRLRADCHLHCTSEVRWEGHTGKAETSPDELMMALPEPPHFERLVKEFVADLSASKTSKLDYPGPVVEVTYQLKRKKEKGSKVASSQAEASEETTEESGAEGG